MLIWHKYRVKKIYISCDFYTIRHHFSKSIFNFLFRKIFRSKQKMTPYIPHPPAAYSSKTFCQLKFLLSIDISWFPKEYFGHFWKASENKWIIHHYAVGNGNCSNINLFVELIYKFGFCSFCFAWFRNSIKTILTALYRPKWFNKLNWFLFDAYNSKNIHISSQPYYLISSSEPFLMQQI